MRVAVRRPADRAVDPADRAEESRTTHLLERKAGLLLDAARTALVRLAPFCHALGMAWQMARRSERGLLRHLAYLVEACGLYRLLTARGVEHVHVHFGTNAAAVARLCHALGGPTYSMTVHGPDEFDAAIGLSLGEKIADAAFTVAVSHFGTSQLRRWCAPEHWDRIHVVRCSVDESFLGDVPAVDPASRTLLCIGRLTPQKEPLILVDALAEVVKADPSVRLVFAGDGELREAVEARIAEHGIGDHVEILGWVDEATVREQLLACRGLVLPSSAEGLPVVLMEALAMERPVISTFVAGIPELVRPGENGWLISAGDVTGLVAAMGEALAASADTLHAYGRAGRRRVQEAHHLPGQIDVLESLLLATQRPTP